VVCVHNGILFGRKKDEILPRETIWMNPEVIMVSEISQAQKDKRHMSSHVILNLKVFLTAERVVVTRGNRAGACLRSCWSQNVSWTDRKTEFKKSVVWHSDKCQQTV
jgi:hypothetical protein